MAYMAAVPARAAAKVAAGAVTIVVAEAAA